jgi:hypothetical protein
VVVVSLTVLPMLTIFTGTQALVHSGRRLQQYDPLTLLFQTVASFFSFFVPSIGYNAKTNTVEVNRTAQIGSFSWGSVINWALPT